MSLLEWFGESLNPGGAGSCELGGRDREPRPRWAILVCLILALGVLGGWFYLLSQVLDLGSLQVFGAAAGGTLFYLVLGYFVHPEPDLDNLGLLGGFIDHPLRYSDDLNRFLVVLVLVLWPGRFIAESLSDGFYLLVVAPYRDRLR